MEVEKMILLCRQRVEEELHWGPSERWSTQDFERLSARIYEKSKIKLSVSTLKRFWGKVQHDGLPSSSTLDALAQYCDFGTWQEFVSSHGKKSLPEKKSELRWWVKYPTLRRIVFMLGLILIGLVISLLFKS